MAIAQSLSLQASTPQPNQAAASHGNAAVAEAAGPAVQAGRFNDFTHVDGMLNPIIGLFDNAANPEVSCANASCCTLRPRTIPFPE